MKITRKTVIAAGVVAAAIAGIAYVMRPKALPVDTALVARGPLETTIDAEGRTRVRERYVVVAPVSGRVERITQIEGTLVHAGDVVARLTAVPLDSQTVMQARARVDAANALILDAASQARVATAALAHERRELSRAQRLAEVGGIAP